MFLFRSKVVLLIILFSVIVTTLEAFQNPSNRVLTGIDVLRKQGFSLLKGKRIGLVTNPTGVASDLQSTIDLLFEAPDVRLVALFSPEHGVRGDIEAGKMVDGYDDARTGLPVYSLYGRIRKPTPEMLRGLDFLVYDIQDIGARSYTYISTMGLAMEAAAENNVGFIVLDRPNPLTGTRVEGPMLESKFRSFVGRYPIPYIYGMTVGELAQMINEEGWLNNGRKCKLTVVQMEGWKRTMWWDETGLSWVPTSPHIPQAMTPLFYTMTGMLGELGTANQGVGYTLPFELVGGPWIDGLKLSQYLNNYNLPGVKFRPMSYRPFYFDTTGIRYNGVQVHIVDRDKLQLMRVQYVILEALLRLFPNRDIFDRALPEKINMFDKVNGTDLIRKRFKEGMSADDLIREIDLGRAPFMITRSKYLIYE